MKYVFACIALIFFATKSVASPLKQSICDAEVTFINASKSKSQNVIFDESTNLKLTQHLSSYMHDYMEVATNVVCQQLDGASYTGSKEEWAGVIKNALDGINAKGATDVKLSLTTELGKVYKGVENNKEYDFRANFGGNKQVIKNLTVVDLKRNTAYTISVSGTKHVEDEIVKEFKRIVGSFKLN